MFSSHGFGRAHVRDVLSGLGIFIFYAFGQFANQRQGDFPPGNLKYKLGRTHDSFGDSCPLKDLDESRPA